jgi:hypothetical protein
MSRCCRNLPHPRTHIFLNGRGQRCRIYVDPERVIPLLHCIWLTPSPSIPFVSAYSHYYPRVPPALKSASSHDQGLLTWLGPQKDRKTYQLSSSYMHPCAHLQPCAGTRVHLCASQHRSGVGVGGCPRRRASRVLKQSAVPDTASNSPPLPLPPPFLHSDSLAGDLYGPKSARASSPARAEQHASTPARPDPSGSSC